VVHDAQLLELSLAERAKTRGRGGHVNLPPSNSGRAPTGCVGFPRHCDSGNGMIDTLYKIWQLSHRH
jgi:hypothetical protein